MGMISTTISGFLAGVIAKAGMTDANEPSGFIPGVVGVFVAADLAQGLGDNVRMSGTREWLTAPRGKNRVPTQHAVFRATLRDRPMARPSAVIPVRSPIGIPKAGQQINKGTLS